MRAIVVSALLLATMISSPSYADGAKKALQLFGVSLKGADQAQLREALKKNNVEALREDDRYWADRYDASSVLEGATDLYIGYAHADRKFAFAEYTFPSNVDAGQVERVIKFVATKYGRPSTQTGNYGLGPVRAVWKFDQSMTLEVRRGWPDTTTYLTYTDIAGQKKLTNEIEADQKEQKNQKAKAQDKAF